MVMAHKIALNQIQMSCMYLFIVMIMVTSSREVKMPILRLSAMPAEEVLMLTFHGTR